jgi:hypothetical protein
MLPTSNKQCEGFVGLKSNKETQRVLLKTIARSQKFENVRMKKITWILECGFGDSRLQ